MSFYAGRYNNKRQCHITRGQHDITTMRGGTGSATVFHTDIKYIDHAVENVGASDGTVSYADDYTGVVYTAYKYYLSDNIKNMISSGYSFFIIDKSTNKYVYEGALIQSTSYYTSPYASATYSIVNQTWSFNNTIVRSPENASVQNLYLRRNTSQLMFVFYGVDYTGVKKDIFSQNRVGEIKINNRQFTVGAYNILTFPYMNTNQLNTADYKVTSTKGDFIVQLINSVPKSAGLEIKTQDETVVKAGGHIVISTDVNSSLMEFGAKIATISIPTYSISSTAGQYKEIIHLCSNYTFSTGDVFAIGMSYTGFPAMRMAKFKNGDIEEIEEFNFFRIINPTYVHGITLFGSSGKLYARLWNQNNWTGGTITYRPNARSIYINVLE